MPFYPPSALWILFFFFFLSDGIQRLILRLDIVENVGLTYYEELKSA